MLLTFGQAIIHLILFFSLFWVTATAAFTLTPLAVFDADDLVIENEPVFISRCTYIGKSELLLLDNQNRTLYTLSPEKGLSVFKTFEEIGFIEKSPISGIWAKSGNILFGLVGKNPELLKYNIESNQMTHWPRSEGIYDLALGDRWTVIVPMPSSQDLNASVLIQDSATDKITMWGNRCASDFVNSDPMTRLACLNKITMNRQEDLFLASLNSGKCEKLNLATQASAVFRNEESHWSMPVVDKNHDLSFDMVVLDIEASKSDDLVFLLTSPKGMHREHALEVYQNSTLIDIIFLGQPFSSITCGEGDQIALIRNFPHTKIAIFKFEVDNDQE